MLFDLPGLRVTIPSPRYLLAMKLMASRTESDEDDIRLLLGLCGIRAVDEALEVLHDLYGNRPIEPEIEHLVAELLAAPRRRGGADTILDAEPMPAPDLIDLGQERQEHQRPYS